MADVWPPRLNAGEDTNMSNLTQQDLPKGFRLVFQALQSTVGGRVRAVVKDSSGAIVTRGPVVAEADAETSKKSALMEWTINHMVVAPEPEPIEDTDFDAPVDGVTDDDDAW